MSIFVLGPEGTHSYCAARAWLGAQATLIPLKSFRVVFDAMHRETGSIGIVPLENSLEGAVTPVLDLLAESPELQIQAVFPWRIRHHIWVKSGTSLQEVRRLYSHPQSFAQCENWLEKNLPMAECIPQASSTHAARLAAEQEGSGIIAGDYGFHGLEIVARDIQDHTENTTRFIQLADSHAASLPTSQPPGQNEIHTFLYFTLPNQAGSLHRALGVFQKHNLNLTHIQSRPLRNRSWEYGFFVELSQIFSPETNPAAWEELKQHAEILRMLGTGICYPQPVIH